MHPFLQAVVTLPPQRDTGTALVDPADVHIYPTVYKVMRSFWHTVTLMRSLRHLQATSTELNFTVLLPYPQSSVAKTGWAMDVESALRSQARVIPKDALREKVHWCYGVPISVHQRLRTVIQANTLILLHRGLT